MDAPLVPFDAMQAEWPEAIPPHFLGTPAGDGWVRLADLAAPGSVALTGALEAMALARGYPDARTKGASFALITTSGLSYQVHCAVLGKPVPLLRPEHTWWQIKPSANVTAVAVEAWPETASPDRLAEALHLTLDGLYAETHRQTGFPVRGQWAMLTSAIGYRLMELFPDDHERAVAICDSMFASDETLTIVKPKVTWLELDGRRRAFTTRRVCCFNYRGRNGHYCSSQCPVVPPGERMAHVLQDLRAG